MSSKDASARLIIGVVIFAILCAIGLRILSLFVHQQRNAAVRQLNEQLHLLDSVAKVIEQIKPLNETYLNGNAGAARQSLVKEINIIENSGLPNAQMVIARLPCCRLYVLDKRLGNPKLAEASLVKARYWYLRDVEIGNVPEREAAGEIVAFTSEPIEKFVDDFDNATTDGRGPAYKADLPLPETRPQ